MSRPSNRKTKHHLGDLQLAIMRVLWNSGTATAADVHRALFRERGLAPTTIATMLRKMEDKGVVSHDLDGRKFRYRAEITEAEVRRSMVDQLAHRLFRGDVAQFASYLISEGGIDARELADLEELVAQRTREEKEDR